MCNHVFDKVSFGRRGRGGGFTAPRAEKGRRRRRREIERGGHLRNKSMKGRAGLHLVLRGSTCDNLFLSALSEERESESKSSRASSFVTKCEEEIEAEGKKSKEEKKFVSMPLTLTCTHASCDSIGSSSHDSVDLSCLSISVYQSD